MDFKYVEYFFDFHCDCNTITPIKAKYAENFIIESPLTIKGQHCPNCGKQVSTPEGLYRIKDGKLVSLY